MYISKYCSSTYYCKCLQSLDAPEISFRGIRPVLGAASRACDEPRIRALADLDALHPRAGPRLPLAARRGLLIRKQPSAWVLLFLFRRWIVSVVFFLLANHGAWASCVRFACHLWTTTLPPRPVASRSKALRPLGVFCARGSGRHCVSRSITNACMSAVHRSETPFRCGAEGLRISGVVG